MTRPSGFPAPFQLGPWLVQAELNRVTGPGGVHQVEPRIMRVLLALVDAGGAVVSRQDLLDGVWSDSVVGEEILTRAVSELRRIFGDDPRRPAYIETIRQHGYRLLMPAMPPPPPPAPAVFPVPHAPSAPSVPPMPSVASEAPGPPPPPPAAPSASPSGTVTGGPVAGPSVARPIVTRVVTLLAVILVAAAAVSAARWWLLRDRGGPASAPVPLTSYPGRELHPALSPDGGRVAFAWSGPDGRQPGVYLKQRNSETPLRLTAEPGWPAWPAWFPDGQSVAFAQSADTASAICLVASLGGPVSRLRTVASLVDGLTVDAGGQRLAWSARATGGGPFRLAGLLLAEPARDWEPAPATGAAGDVQPRFSPDGRWLAWVALGPDGGGSIHRIAATGGRVERVVNARGPVAGLAWSPAGDRLVYAAAPAGTFGLWSVAAEGGEPVPLPATADFCLHPTVASRTGDLAWEQVRLDQDLWSLRTTGREPWRFETAPFLVSTRWEAEADLEPGGGRVVFVSLRSGRPALWTAGPDGTGPVLLTEVEGAALSSPRWSPDGARVVFRAVSAGGTAVMVVPATGGKPRAVPLESTDALPAGWTHDGRALLVSADLGDGWQVHRVDPVDGRRQALTRDGGLAAAESADGRVLYHTRPGLAGLWKLDLAPDSRPEIEIGALPAGDRAAWRLAEGAVYWVLRTRGAAVLMRHDLASGATAPLAELPGAAAGGLAVAQDGSLVLYPHAGEASGDLMLQAGRFLDRH